MNEFDPSAFWGDKGLINLLKGKDKKLWPAEQNQDADRRILDGGYTIKTFGSSRLFEGLVAIQCEVIPEYRLDPQKRELFARAMSECIWNFVEPFI